MSPEEVQDFVREGDVVVVKATVLEILPQGAIRTHSVHPAYAVRSHERVFRPGDQVKAKSTAAADRTRWRIVHVHGDVAWIEPCPRSDGNKGFIWPTDDLVHAIPGVDMRVDSSSSS